MRISNNSTESQTQRNKTNDLRRLYTSVGAVRGDVTRGESAADGDVDVDGGGDDGDPTDAALLLLLAPGIAIDDVADVDVVVIVVVVDDVVSASPPIVDTGTSLVVVSVGRRP
jgi:hypothetical protein